MSRVLSVLGILMTTVYLGGVIWLFCGRADEILVLPPNELGDFLAGVFGPLAILWLILGFFQQGIELRQNTHALELQAKELQNSVEQQEILADVSRKQLEAELEKIQYEREMQRQAAQPDFHFSAIGGSFIREIGTYRATIQNVGNAVTQVLIAPDLPLQEISLGRVAYWQRGEEKRLEWKYDTPLAEKSLTLTISYLDVAGLPGAQVFDVVPNLHRNHNMVEITKRVGKARSA